MTKKSIVTFSIASILSISSMGCLAAPPSREPASPIASVQVQPAPQQQQQQSFGENPQGFVADPSNPNRGFMSVGGSLIPVTRGPNGWEGDSPRNTRSIMDSTPDRYTPMVTFLEDHSLSLRDWNTLGEAYAQSDVTDQKAQARINFLKTLTEVIQDTPPTNLQSAADEAKRLRTVLNQF
jgi:hypothetical protein